MPPLLDCLQSGKGDLEIDRQLLFISPYFSDLRNPLFIGKFSPKKQEGVYDLSDHEYDLFDEFFNGGSKNPQTQEPEHIEAPQINQARLALDKTKDSVSCKLIYFSHFIYKML